MQSRSTVEIQGGRELDEQLRKLLPQKARSIMAQALRAGAAPIASDARARLAWSAGRQTSYSTTNAGHLKTAPHPGGTLQTVAARVKRREGLSVEIGPAKSHAHIGAWKEYGHKRGARDKNLKRVTNRIYRKRSIARKDRDLVSYLAYSVMLNKLTAADMRPDVKAEPWLGPAFDANAPRSLSIITTQVAAGLEKIRAREGRTRERAARTAARQTATANRAFYRRRGKA